MKTLKNKAPEAVFSTQPGFPARSQIGAMLNMVRQMIVSGEVMPGAKMPIGPICERFDVSPGAVREALSRLVSEGLVVAEEQRGFRVAPISHAALTDITQTRILIESEALRLSIAQGDTRWEADIIAAFHRLSRAPYFEKAEAGAMPRGWAIEHEAFHRSLISASGSEWLMRFHDILFMQTERYRRLSRLSRYRQNRDEIIERRDVRGEHQKILDAVLERDAEGAIGLISAHFLGTVSRVGEAYSDAVPH